LRFAFSLARLSAARFAASEKSDLNSENSAFPLPVMKRFSNRSPADIRKVQDSCT